MAELPKLSQEAELALQRAKQLRASNSAFSRRGDRGQRTYVFGALSDAAATAAAASDSARDLLPPWGGMR